MFDVPEDHFIFCFACFSNSVCHIDLCVREQVMSNVSDLESEEVAGCERKLHNEDPRDLHSSANGH